MNRTRSRTGNTKRRKEPESKDISRPERAAHSYLSFSPSNNSFRKLKNNKYYTTLCLPPALPSSSSDKKFTIEGVREWRAGSKRKKEEEVHKIAQTSVERWARMGSRSFASPLWCPCTSIISHCSKLINLVWLINKLINNTLTEKGDIRKHKFW